jgi:hypothetical protein
MSETDHFHLKLKQTLPEEYEIISLFADVLPADASSPAFPFISSDDCEGGDTCFLEPGIRLGLRNGDFLVFPSTAISHFNLHFKGKRVSVVMHTDNAGKEWVKNRNGWSGSAFMNVSYIGTGDL